VTAAFQSRLPDITIGDPRELALIALRAADLADIERLLSDGEVAQWWRDFDIDDIAEFLDHDYVSPFRIVLEGRTVGYAQTYHANRDQFWVDFGVPRETFGIDLSIGVASLRNRGVGRAAVKLLVDRLLAWPEVVRLQIDPEATNERAIRAYGAAGFVARGVFPGYDGDEMLYMTIERESVPLLP
jgi:aminoglycoside 6'-N-acetyltransferase